VNIEAQGKEVYGLRPAARTMTLKKGLRRTTAIRQILVELMGENPNRMSIPNLPKKLGSTVSITRKDLPWKAAQKIAQSLNMELFYDNAGVPTLARVGNRPEWEFIAGEVAASKAYGSTRLTTPLTTEADLTRLVNKVRVVGRTPKNKKKPVSASAVADFDHPLSPWKLGPEGAPQVYTHEIRNDHLRTERECRELAETELDKRLKLIHDVSFSAGPVPHFDYGTVVRIRTGMENVERRLDTYTLPLGLGGDMTVGYAHKFKLKRR